MSGLKGSSRKKRLSEFEASKPEIQKRKIVEDDFDPEFSNDIKGIMTALQQIKEKAQKDGQKKNEETISSVAVDIKSKIDELRAKVEKERQSFAKALSKSSKECENLLKSETAKFQALYDKFCKEKATHLQVLKGTLWLDWIFNKIHHSTSSNIHVCLSEQILFVGLSCPLKQLHYFSYALFENMRADLVVIIWMVLLVMIKILTTSQWIFCASQWIVCLHISDPTRAPTQRQAKGCMFGDKCHFAHGEWELGRPTAPSMKTLVLWDQGKAAGSVATWSQPRQVTR